MVNSIITREQEEYDKYLRWKEEIISSGIEYSKDELKYNKKDS